MPKNTMETTIFKKVDVRKPTKEPVAARIASSPLRWANHHSPIKAPRKGPQIKPKGIGTINPMTRPRLVPHTPNLEPPKALVPFAGIQ